MNWDADFAGLPPIELPDGASSKRLVRFDTRRLNNGRLGARLSSLCREPTRSPSSPANAQHSKQSGDHSYPSSRRHGAGAVCRLPLVTVAIQRVRNSRRGSQLGCLARRPA